MSNDQGSDIGVAAVGEMGASVGRDGGRDGSSSVYVKALERASEADVVTAIIEVCGLPEGAR